MGFPTPGTASCEAPADFGVSALDFREATALEVLEQAVPSLGSEVHPAFFTFNSVLETV
ncbi:MAG: hypothetical protein PVH41_01990 [Anaerolineae bacterium]